MSLLRKVLFVVRRELGLSVRKVRTPQNGFNPLHDKKKAVRLASRTAFFEQW